MVLNLHKLMHNPKKLDKCIDCEIQTAQLAV